MAKKGEKAQSAGARVRKVTKRQQKKLDKKQARVNAKIPNSFQLIGQSYQVFRKNWRVLLGVVVVYLILNVVLASGFGAVSTAIDNVKYTLATSGHSLSNALDGFGTLLGSAGTNNSGTGSVMESFLLIVESLVIIWALRQLLAGKAIRVKEAYYSSMGPFIPFVLVVAVILLQLLPMVIGAAVASAVLGAIFNSGGGLTFAFIVISLPLAAWSIYMVSSSIFALYIVTLPDMEPIKSLRSAKNLVKYRRWAVLRRLLFLPIFILLAMAIIIVPLLLFATALVAPVFYFLAMLAILFFHTYLYSLYRSLLE